MVQAVSAITIGYLLGSIPSAYIIGRIWGKLNLLQEGDGHISATAIYRYLGLRALIVVVIMELAKAALSLYIAHVLTGSLIVGIFTGLATVIGHCWSVYIKFKGGLGATVTYGVLVILAWWEFFIAGAIAGILVLTTRRASLTFYVLLTIVSIILFIEREPLTMALFPIGLMLIQILKRFQTRKQKTAYKNELFTDFRRTKKPA